MTQDILITPGSGEPQILFRGSGVSDTPIELNVLSSYQSATGSGTALVFEGQEGQLFAVTDNLSSGTIFSVGDITGLSMLSVDASGDVKLGEFANSVIVYPGLTLDDNVPSSTSNVLYNDGGDLMWNGVTVIQSGAAQAVDGSGTASYVARFTDTNTLGTGVIYDNGTNVGIGTDSPSQKLDVAGGIGISGSFIDTRSANGSFTFSGTTTTRYLNILNNSDKTWVTAAGNVANNLILRAGSNTYQLYLAGDGDIGIDTETPTQKLDIRYPAGGGMALLKSTDTNDGLLFGDMAYSTNNTYQGIKHAAMTGANDYMILSTGSHTWISSSANNDVVINAGGDNTNSNIRVKQLEVVVNENGSSNDFRVESNNDANALFVDGVTDYVGIGTASPQRKLEVYGTTNAQMAITSPNTTAYREILFYEGATVIGDIFQNGSTQTNYAGAYSLNLGNLQNAPIAFYTNGLSNERMRIAAGGNVGIGTTSPSEKLDVVGVIKSSSSIISPAFFSETVAATSTPGGATGGMGTPANVNITNISGYTYHGGYIRFNKSSLFNNDSKAWIGAVYNSNYGHDIRIYSSKKGNSLLTEDDSAFNAIFSQDVIRFYTGPAGTGDTSARLTIDSAGDVGIGTTSPSYKLDVNGTTRITPTASSTTLILDRLSGQASIKGGSDGYVMIESNGTGNRYISLNHYGSENVNLVYGGGNVGIGTISPSEKLHVAGDVLIDGNGATIGGTTWNNGLLKIGSSTNGISIDTNEIYGSNALVLGSLDNSNHIMFKHGTVERMRVASGGNIGINTTSPQDLLHVNGGRIRIENVTDPKLSFNDGSANRSEIFYDTSEETFVLNHTDADANQLVLTSGNNVGIGTNDPNATLHVYSAVSGDNVFNVEGTNGSLFGVTDNLSGVLMSVNTIAGLPVLEVNSDYSVTAGRFNQNDFTISSSGDIGIGTASPTSPAKLVVKTSALGDEAVRVYNSDNIETFTLGHLNADNSSFFAMRDDQGNAGVLLRTDTYDNYIAYGNFGLGTTTPSEKLHVMGGTRLQGDSTNTTWTSASPTLAIKRASSSPYISFHADTGGRLGYLQFNSSNVNRLNVETYNDLIIHTNSLERMTVSKDGYVNFSNYIRIDHDNDERGIIFEDSGGTDSIYMTVNDGQGNFNIMLGVNHDGNRIVTGDGLSKILMTGHGVNGQISLNAGQTGTGGASAVYNIGLSIDSNDQKLRIGNPSDNIGLDDQVGNIIADVDGDLITRYLRARDANGIQIGDDSDTLGIFVKDGGNVGIGTASPVAKLDVNGQVRIDSVSAVPASCKLLVGDVVDANSAVPVQVGGAIRLKGGLLIHDNTNVDRSFYLQHTSPNGLRIYRNAGQGSANIILAESVGNVGIGTLTPQQKLHIDEGNIRIENSTDPKLEFHDGAAVGAYVKFDTSEDNLVLSHVDVAGDNQIALANDGNVGIGTASPNAVLHAYGSTPSGTVFNVEGTNGSLFSVVDNLSGVLMSVNNNAGLPVFEVNDDDSIVGGRFAQNDFVVTTSGDIGMGTANPASKLEVNGTVTATCASLGQLNVDNLRLDGNTLSSTNTGGNVIITPNGTGGIAAGVGATVTGNYAVVGGGILNNATQYASTVSGGYLNTASAIYSTVSGGYSNDASGSRSTVGGGAFNWAIGGTSTVSGGFFNCACATNSSVSGGCKNFVNARHGSINGGHFNIIQSPTNECCSRGATIGGGIGHNTSGGTVNSTTGDITGTVTCCNAGAFSTIGGGFRNCSTGSCSTVSGGRGNTASDYYSTVSGGYSNTASGCYSTIGGGIDNEATSVATYSVIGGGINNTVSAYSAMIGGGWCNTASAYYGTISGGLFNTASGYASTVGGGYCNCAAGYTSTVSGGWCNRACATNSSVSGGCNNFVNARHGSINGGHFNVIQSPTNECCARGATIGGGVGHNTSGGTINGTTGDTTGTVTCLDAGRFSTISGGLRNCATGANSTISGGNFNTASGNYSIASGGRSNTASGQYSTIGGGTSNCATANYSTVSGGSDNIASGFFATVGGGFSNTSSQFFATVSGGYNNTVSTFCATVSGGGNNCASGGASTVGGGGGNCATANLSTVSGGRSNTASGSYSTVIGGYHAKASRYGEVAHAAGRFAANGDAQHSTFVARRNTTDATANVELFLDGVDDRMILTAETTWTFDIKLSAYNDTDNTTAWWIIRGGIRRDAANNTSLIGSLIEERDYEGTMSGTSAAVTADDTNESLKIAVTGLASKNIRWVAVVDVAQVSWGTP